MKISSSNFDDKQFSFYQQIKTFSDKDFIENTKFLVDHIFQRAELDEIAAFILSKIDSCKLSREDLINIKKMFYLSPMNFVSFDLQRLGFCFDQDMAKELIFLLEHLYDENLYLTISKILIPFCESSEIIDVLINLLSGQRICFLKTKKLENCMVSRSNRSHIVKISSKNGNQSSFLYKKFVIENVPFESLNIDLFVKLIYYYLMENDIFLVKLFVIVFLKTFKTVKLDSRHNNCLMAWFKSPKFIKKFARLGILIYGNNDCHYNKQHGRSLFIQKLKKSSSAENDMLLKILLNNTEC